MRLLWERAHEAYTAFTTAASDRPRRSCSFEEEAELRALWGRTRLVDKGSRTSPSSTLVGSMDGVESACAKATTPESTVSIDSTDFFAGLMSTSDWPSLDLPPSQLDQPMQWTPFAPTLPPGLDGITAMFDTSFAPAAGMAALAAAAAIAPPEWSAPLYTPSPETGAEALPGPTLDATWQRFMDGIGLPFGNDGTQDQNPIAHGGL